MVPQHMGMHSPYTRVHQYIGAHSDVLGTPVYWECIPIYWGTPVNRECIPIYWGTPVSCGEAFPICRGTPVDWDAFPMYSGTVAMEFLGVPHTGEILCKRCECVGERRMPSLGVFPERMVCFVVVSVLSFVFLVLVVVVGCP